MWLAHPWHADLFTEGRCEAQKSDKKGKKGKM